MNNLIDGEHQPQPCWERVPMVELGSTEGCSVGDRSPGLAPNEQRQRPGPPAPAWRGPACIFGLEVSLAQGRPGLAKGPRPGGLKWSGWR